MHLILLHYGKNTLPLYCTTKWIVGSSTLQAAALLPHLLPGSAAGRPVYLWGEGAAGGLAVAVAKALNGRLDLAGVAVGNG